MTEPKRREIAVLLVDDEALMRSGLRLLLEGSADMSVVAEAENGQEAVAAVAALHPDVVLMDVRMPVMGGIEALKDIRTADPDAPPVVMLTAFDTDSAVLESLRAGAAGFILKSCSPATLQSAVRAAAHDQPVISPQSLDRLLRLADTAESPRVMSRRGHPKLATLSGREREIADLIAQGLGNQEIAALLFVTLATVKTHVARLMTKLGVDSRVQVAIAVLEESAGK
ncbi:response regulator [Nocardioides aequoreus]|uniref:response regulator n=1 Tax=Nocardioides aequoreus TaxID=397278 RepID=UPI0004C32625|nr:response regulator transcription factor [Nocardioides aequoreus]